jgi:hypothetical protein
VTPAQEGLYFREWGKVRRHLRAQGIDPKQADAKRHQLHKKALGVDKSHSDFTNADVDKVFAVFRAVTKPDNLEAQIHALDQPALRLAQLQSDARSLVGRLPKVKAAKEPAAYVENYLNQIARSVVGVVFAELGEKDAARVLGIVRHRLGEQIKEAELEAANCAF